VIAALLTASAAGGALLRAPRHARAAARATVEAEIKVEFIERITRFVEWPAGSFSDPDGPFVLCTMGQHGLGDFVARLAKDRKVRDRRVHLVTAKELDELKPCHLVFIGKSEAERLDKILLRTGNRPILTVADSAGFGERGVLVNFYRDGDNVRFEINAKAAEKTGLKLSSKVLRLAKIVGKP
jgi:hypothetical protein